MRLLVAAIVLLAALANAATPWVDDDAGSAADDPATQAFASPSDPRPRPLYDVLPDPQAGYDSTGYRRPAHHANPRPSHYRQARGDRSTYRQQPSYELSGDSRRPGYDRSGYSRQPSYDRAGSNERAGDRSNYDERPSYDRTAYNERPSYDRTAYNEPPSYDRTAYNEPPSYDRTAYNERPSYDRTAYNERPSYDRTAYNEPPSYDRTAYNERPSYDRTAYNERPSYDRTAYNERPSYDRTAYNEPPSYDRTAYNERPNYDRTAYNERPGYGRTAYNERPGYGRMASNERTEYDRTGYSRSQSGAPGGGSGSVGDERTRSRQEAAARTVTGRGRNQQPSTDGAEPVCAKTCSSPDDGSSGYRAGQQYVYLYRGEAVTNTAGEQQQQQEQSSMSVAARVVVTVGISSCDLRLQIPSLEMEGDSAWFKEAVQAHDLYFSYQGGRIEDVCPHEEEAAAATNFKRAVLSMLHTSVTNPPARVIVRESDVAGECETQYRLMSKENDKVVLNKTKHDCLSSLHLPYLPHSSAPTSHMSVVPYFRSNQECHMESLTGVWQNVECQQQVKVDGPLAPSKGPITLAMSSSLVLETTRPDGNPRAFHQEQRIRRESLRMNFEKAGAQGQPQEASQILAQVADIMEVLAREDRKEVEWPRIFSHLVSLMGLLQHQEDLQDIWDTYSGQDNYKDVVLDGLLACDSGPCVELVTHLATEVPSPLSSTTLSSWLAGIHLQSHTDPSSITHIMSLVESRPEAKDVAVMAASSLVFRVCQKDHSACHSHAQVFLKYVREEVGEGCGWGQTKQQQQRVKFALQALGNAGVIPNDHFSERCYMNKLLPTELRVAALQTLRRSGCSGSKVPWTVLEDGSDSIEVRVAAYLALQPCATIMPQFFHRLQKLLEKEQVNQVGSFIWTHVHNLAEHPGASQEEKEVARLAAQLTLNNKFNSNPFQASRNYRLAQFSEVLGIGGIIDGNVIFSPESYLPRTAALNLTLELLGKSVNVFEIGGNFKGLEDYIEKFFEKGKYFENEDIKKLLLNLRPKRDASMDKLEEYQAMYNEAKMKKEAIEGEEEEPTSSLYLRVFGNEIMHSENVLKSDPLKVIQETFQHLSSPRAFQIMNQEFVMPTLLGFPLRLKYNATGSLSLNKEGRLQALSPGQLLLEGKLSPTVAVTSDETLMLDGYGSYSGIRRSTTHHAHSHLGGKISIHEGHLVDAQLDLPKTEVVKIYSSVKITLFSNTNQGWSELAAHNHPEESEGCSSKGLSDIIGLQVCHVERSAKQLTDGDVADRESYEKKIVISKTDNFDKFVFSLRKAESTFEAVVDTPGSSVDRKVSVVVNSHSDSVGSTIVVPGRKVEGQYQWSPAHKRLALKYFQDSEVQGELDVTLQSMREGPSIRHTPQIVVSLPGLLEVRANGSLLLGPTNLAWNGTFMSSLQNHPAASQGKWELMGEQHHASARVAVGQNFGSISGSVIRESAMTLVEAKCEYGTDSAQPNTLSLTAHFTDKLENREKSLQGHLSIQSSQAGTSLNMDVRHQLGHTAANASLSLPSATINSTLVAKNIGEKGKRDFEMSFSVFSPQLALNYLGRTLYKVSDGDFQAEAEVRLGTLGHTKVSVSHLLQCQPFHALAGLHLQLNDHLLQAGYNVDLSQPHHTEIMVSGAVGAASAVFHVEADHSHTRPLRGLLKVFGGYNGKQVGVMLHTASDAKWQSFNGSLELTWFEQFYVVRHEALWSDTRKGITLSRNQSFFQLMYELSPRPQVLIMVKSSRHPTLQVVAEKTEDVRSKTYQTYVMQGVDRPLHISATWNKNQSFSGSLKLLKSEMRLSGLLTHPYPHHLEGSAQVTVVLPSSETFTSDFTLSHAYDGITRELNVSSVSNGLKYEGKFKLKQYDGWFSNDSLILTVNFTTPLAGLHSAALSLETHSDPSQISFIQVEFEDIKVRGETQVGDPANLFDVKLQYEAGHGNCDSHIHLYHKYVHEKYLTGTTLRLTQEHDPWGLQIVTILGNTHGKKSLEAEFTSPILSSPFYFYGNYSRSESHLDLKLQGGMESQASLTVSGKSYLKGNTQIYGGTLDLQSPWTSPLFVNVSHHHGEHGLNMTLDFHSAWHPVNNIKADFGVTFVNSSDLQAHLHLNHEHLQVMMDLDHRLTKDGLSNQLEFSTNVARVTSKIICTWDENFVPQSATGHLSVINVFDEPQDFSFSFIKGISDFHTQLLGSHGSNLLRVEHQLQVSHLMEWMSTLSVVLPNREDIIENKMTLNIMPDLSSLKWEFFIKSPWTEEIKSHFSSQRLNSLRETEFVAVYGDSSLAELTLKTPEPFSWYQSSISLNISSSHFSAIDVHWKHKFGNENIVTTEIYVDGEFYLKGEQKLMLSRSKLTENFEQFHFVFMVNIPSNDFDFETKLLFNSDLSGEFETESGDYLLYVTSLHNAGELLSFVIQGPLEEWKATLNHDPGPSSLPNLLLDVTKDGTDILTFGSKFTELYPKVDGLFTVRVRFENEDFVKNGQLHITADMSRIQDCAFKGAIKLDSNFEGFEKYWAELDTDINNELGSVNGNLSGMLHIGDWHYRTNLHGMMELHHNFSLSYKTEYTFMYQQQLLDKKEISLLFLANKMNLFVGNITVITGPQTPQWVLFLSYNPQIKEFKAHVIPGSERKYQVMVHVDASVFKIDSQVVSEDRSAFKVIAGDISWTFRRRRRQIKVDLSSDFSMFQSVKGIIGIQRRRRLGVNAKLMINEAEFSGNMTYIPASIRAPARLSLELKNDVFIPFKTNINLTYSLSPGNLESHLVIDLNEEKNWVIADAKGSLPKSYIMLKLPYKDFENVTISLKISTEQYWGVEANMLLPKLCVNLEGKMDPKLKFALVSTKVLRDCEDELFDFHFSYEIDMYSFNVTSHCHLQKYGHIYRFEAAGELTKAFQFEVKLEIQVYSFFSLGLELSSAREKKGWSLMIHAYNPVSDWTHFLYKHSVTFNQSDISVEVNERDLLSLKTHHNIQASRFAMNGTFSHSFSYLPFSAQLTADGKTEENLVEINLGLTTSSPRFSQADLQTTYKSEENKKVTLKLLSTLGNAEGSIVLQEASDLTSITLDMTSSLHSFEEYHIELTHKNEGNNHHFSALSIQDDLELELEASFLAKAEGFLPSLRIGTPFKLLETLHVSLGYPRLDSSGNFYTFNIHGITNGYLYGFTFTHDHDRFWHRQNTTVIISTPSEGFGNFSFSAVYDVSSHANMHLGSSEGEINFNADWQDFKTHFIFNSSFDLSHFGWGKYVLHCDIPHTASRNEIIQFEYNHSHINYTCQFAWGRNFNFAKLSLDISDSSWAVNKTAYSFGYDLYRKKNLIDLQGQYKEIEVTAVIKLKKNALPPLSGTFKVQTNINKYKVINGSWNITRRDQAYIADAKLDIDEETVLSLSGQFNNQPQGTSTPWKKLELDVLFESSFTLTHHLHAEYEISTWSLSSWYKHGLDHFHLKLIPKLKQRAGTLLVTGNIPIRGLSTFNLEFNYKLKEVYTASLIASIEETNLISSVELEPRRSWSSVKASLTSPFFKPMRASLLWTFKELPWLVDSSITYGKYVGELKIKANPYGNLKQLELQMNLPFKFLYKGFFTAKYSTNQAGHIHATAEFAVNNHTLNVESKIKYSNEITQLEFLGLESVYGTEGRLEINYETIGNQHNGNASVTWTGHEIFTISLIMDPRMIQLDMKNNVHSYLSAKLTLSQVEIKFFWNKETYLNVSGSFIPHPDNYDLRLTVDSSETQPVMLKSRYSYMDGQEGTAFLSVGEREYNVSVRGNISKKTSRLQLHLHSSESPHTPIIFKAEYNVRDYLRGRMTSMKNLASVTFEWGEKIQLLVQGKRNRNQSNMKFEILTPFRSLPRLTFGYDSEFSLARSNIEVMCTISVEWSEKITFTGIFKLVNGDVDAFVGLTSSYSDLKMLDTSLKFNSSHIEAITTVNKNRWNVTCDYQLYPFSVAMSINTPVEDYKTLSFAASGSLQDGHLSAEAELIWTSTIKVQVEAELWDLDIKLDTPWNLLQDASLKMSLRTESEALMCMATAHWNHSTVMMKTTYSPLQLKIVGEYKVESTEIGFVMFEYAFSARKYKAAVQIRTPFIHFKSLELEFNIKPKNHDYMIDFITNDSEHTLQLTYSKKQGKLKVHLPMLSKFMWTLEAKKMWSELNIEASVSLDEMSAPMKVSFSYLISPEDKKANISVQCEFPHKWMESLNFNTIVTYDDTSVKTSWAAVWNFYGEEPTNFNGNLTCGISKKHISIEMKLETSYFEYPIKMTCKIPLFNFFIKEGTFEFVFIQKETYNAMYKTRNGNEVYALHHFTIDIPEWSCAAELILKEQSFNLSVSYPDSSRKHILSVKWPHISLENFAVSMELYSPYLPQEGLMVSGNLIVKRKFAFSFNSTASYGQNFISGTGTLQYTKKLRELKWEGKIMSNLIDNHHLEASVRWLRNIKANIQLKISDQEHTCSLVVDVTNYTLELNCSSSWLPYRNCTIRGKINNDFSISKIKVEGQLTGFTESESLTVEATVSENDSGLHSAKVTIKQGSLQLHQVSAHVTLKKTLLKIKFTVQSDDPRLRTKFELQIKNNSEMRYFSANISNYYIPYTHLHVQNDKNWRKLQHLSFISSKCEFVLSTAVDKTSGNFILGMKLFSFELRGSIHYDFSGEYTFKIDLDTSLDILQSLTFKIQLPTDANTQLLKLYVRGKNDQESRMDIHCFPDVVMKWSVWVFISTPLSGFEKFQLMTPQFNYKSHIFRAFAEYPGGKVGGILTSKYRHKMSSDMQFSLYLPFEKYDIVSLKIVDNDISLRGYYAVEMRVGKVGFTLSLKNLSHKQFWNFEFLIKLNEWSMKANFIGTWKSENVKVKLHIDFIPKDILGIQFFSTQFRYRKNEEFFFIAKSDSEDLVKAHWFWSENKIFSLTTPRVYPGYLVFHLESGQVVQDCQLKASLSTAAGVSESLYGFHIHHRQLEAGHHISVLGLAPQKHFYMEGTHYMSSKLLNESLAIEVNKKQVGYKAYFERDPGMFTSTYTGGMSLMLPVHSVHFNTTVVSAIRGIDSSSMLTWGKRSSLRKPLNLKLKYNDYSVFNKGRHHLNAVLSHPDIKDVTLLANITRTNSSSLHGSAELVDGNSPEMKVVATMEVEPVRDDGRQTVSLSLSQPVSNFSMLLEAQLRQDPLTEALCKLKYYSLTSETWHQVNLSASLESQGSGHALMVVLMAPQKEWGHTWRGALDSKPEEASVSLEGSSLEFGDTWKLGSVVKRHVPELLTYLSVGKELEVYEEARVRLGLHSPIEVGAALDHIRFGEWHQDVALGLRLTSSHVLQAFLDFDPSLDYNDKDFITRLASPLHKMLHAWRQDVVSTVLDVSQWMKSEASTLSQVMVNKQVLQTVWNSEVNSFFDFLGEAEGVILQISGQSSLFWRELVMPRLQESFRLVSIIYEWTQASLHHAAHHISLQLHRWTAAFELRWRVFSYHLASLHYHGKVWWAQTEVEMEAYLHATMYWVVRVINLATATVQDWVADLRDTFHQHLHTLRWITARYSQDLSNTFVSECWWPVQHMGNQLHHSLTQIMDSSWTILRQFLQPETTIPMLNQASQYITSQAQQALTIIQDGLQELKESLPDTSSFTLISQLYQNLQALLKHSLPVLYDLMENGVPAMVPHITSVVDKVMSFVLESINAMERYSGGGTFFSYISAVSGNVYGKLLAIWEGWKEKDHAADTTTAKLFMEIMKKVLNLDSDIFIESYVFEPEVRGQVVYNQHLPVAWPSFLHTPHWHSVAWQSGVSEAQRILQDGVEMTSNNWGATWLPGSLFLPFTATATIIGQHITTFDLHHYQFLGPCSYLLARDFVGGDFSLVGVYQAEAGVVGLASIQVLTPSRTFVLNVSGSVDASQQHSEVQSANGQSSLKVGGVLVSCDQAIQGCSITVSNKYFGRLAGLLGNYNHEPSDDSQGPDGQQVASPAQLATKWAIGDQPCYQANKAVQMKVESAGAGVAECSLLFLKGNSPFSRCFYSVKPQPYFTHCISNKKYSKGEEKPSHDVCGAVTAYVTQCLTYGVSLPYPDKCKRGKERIRTVAPVLSGSCEVPGGEPVPSQWSKRFQGETQGSADLAFIIELANCNKGKNLQLFLQLLKVHMRRAGSEDVRYALMTVREGSVGQPSPFMKEEDMLTLLNTLDLQGPRDDQGGAAAIISAAKHLKWRPGVSRTVVQLSCRPCDAGEMVHQALQENDITFHLVTKHKVIMAGPDSKKREAMAKKLLGFDSKFGYTVRDIKKFSGTEKLRAALQEPEGSCVVAAQASGGSVFNMNKWLPSKEILAKKFLRVLSHRVAVSTAAPECQKCQCVGGATEMKLQCRECSSEFTVPQEVVMEGTHPSVWQHAGKKNYTIKADIKKNFVHQFVDENVALAGIENGNENANFYESVTEEQNSSEEEEEEREDYEDYEENSFNQNYYNYEGEY